MQTMSRKSNIIYNNIEKLSETLLSKKKAKGRHVEYADTLEVKKQDRNTHMLLHRLPWGISKRT